MDESKFIAKVLKYLIKEANDWHDECHGTQIESEEMEEAKNLLEAIENMSKYPY